MSAQRTEPATPATSPRERASLHDVGAAGLSATVVVSDRVYPMFGVRALSTEGALLTGSLLLEEGEELTLELSREPGSGAPTTLQLEQADLPARDEGAASAGERACAQARVLALICGEVPGMEVAFVALEQRDRSIIEQWVARAITR